MCCALAGMYMVIACSSAIAACVFEHNHRVCPPTTHWVALGPQEAPTAAQGRTSRVHRPQGGGGRTPRDHRRSGRDSTELRPQTWVFGPGGGRGRWATGAWGKEGSPSGVTQRGPAYLRAHRMSCQAPRCTQKGHGFLRAEACDACENADEGNRADDPHTLRAAHQPTSLVGTTPLAAAKSLDGLRGRGQELQAAHLRGRAQQMTASHRADERSPAAQEATELLRYGDNGLRESHLHLDGAAALLLQSI